MKNTALSIYTLGLALVGFTANRAEAVDAFTDPVGYYTLNIVGASDNVMSLPMVRDAVFAGTVGNGAIGVNNFSALAGTVSPAWTAAQFQYRDAAQAQPQPQTYYVEFTSGALKGLFYKIDNNGTDTLTLDTEEDKLNESHSFTGNPVGALAVGDSFKIRPYWRVKDIFENNGTPVLDSRPTPETVGDEILFPDYNTVSTNKAPNLRVFHVAGQGWRGQGQGSTDFANYILRPNESFIVRRQGGNVSITNLGGVLMNKSISFISGGNSTTGNDIYFSINRPAPVSLNDSGLYSETGSSVFVASVSMGNRADELLAFDDTPGINKAPIASYFYVAGKGWRQASNSSTSIGTDVKLQPGKSYIIRKKKNNAGRDWVNAANY